MCLNKIRPIILTFVSFLCGCDPVVTGNRGVEKDMARLAHSLDAYWVQYHALPGKDPATIANTLLGDNPRKIEFLESDAIDRNASGEFIDYWGNPFKFEFSEIGVTVISIGKDGTYGGRANDDLRFPINFRNE